jgi:hypothetical protein
MSTERTARKNNSNDLEAGFEILDDLLGSIRKMMSSPSSGGTIPLKAKKTDCSIHLPRAIKKWRKADGYTQKDYALRNARLAWELIS